MAHLIAIPKLGLTMTDCTLVGWNREDGDRVEQGEVLYTIETDKITSDVEIDASGFLRRYAEVDTIHEVGAVIGGLYPTREAALAATVAEGVLPPAFPDHEEIFPAAAAEPATTVQPAPISDKADRKRVSPLARRVAAQAGLDVSIIVGTGAQGAVLRRDVDAEAARLGAAVATASAPIFSPPVDGRGDQRRPLTGMRRAISQKMMQSLQSTAQMTGFGKVNMTEAVKLRGAFVADEVELGIRVTYTDIILKVCADALSVTPEMNSAIIGDEIVTWADINVGLAVALDDGLIVPVIRNADRKSIVEIAHERADLARRARANQLLRDDLDGGTFSLSNFGSYGGDFETPILNAPQSAIFGMGAITDEPVVLSGQITIAPMMMMSLTFDHRLIDGAVAGRFRARVRAALEKPYSMLARMR